MPNVDIQQVFKNAEDLINAGGRTEMNMASVPNYKEQASKLLINLFNNATRWVNKNGEMTAKNALDFQRAIGRQGNWSKDIDKGVAESVYNTIYNSFRRNFQLKAPTKELKLLNQKMHDLILVDTNMARRFPQLSRYAPLGLEDTLYAANAISSENPIRGITAGILNKTIRSPGLYPLGNGIKNVSSNLNDINKAVTIAKQYNIQED
jgi:hypothetical protein